MSIFSLKNTLCNTIQHVTFNFDLWIRQLLLIYSILASHCALCSCILLNVLKILDVMYIDAYIHKFTTLLG